MFCDAVAHRFIDVTGSFEDAEGERLVRTVQMERPEPINTELFHAQLVLHTIIPSTEVYGGASRRFGIVRRVLYNANRQM